MSLEKIEFVCIDCETTGLDSENDRIVEVACAQFSFSGKKEQFDTLINPQMAIPQESVAIHHITEKMVEDQPTIDEVLPKLFELIGERIIVGHGIQFDVDMIAAAAKRADIACPIANNRLIDTLRLARLYGQSPVNSLERLRMHFNIGEEGAHRALSDVTVNIAVFKQLAKSFKTLDEIFQVLAKPILMKTMPLGKYKGRPMKEVPVEYLQWAVHKDFDQDLLFSMKRELQRRKKGDHFSSSANPFSVL